MLTNILVMILPIYDERALLHYQAWMNWCRTRTSAFPGDPERSPSKRVRLFSETKHLTRSCRRGSPGSADVPSGTDSSRRKGDDERALLHYQAWMNWCRTRTSAFPGDPDVRPANECACLVNQTSRDTET